MLDPRLKFGRVGAQVRYTGSRHSLVKIYEQDSGKTGRADEVGRIIVDSGEGGNMKNVSLKEELS
jgi:hypothetical protein